MLFQLTLVLMTCISSFCFAYCGFYDCCQSFEMGVGWRRDDIKWKVNCLETCNGEAFASSHIDFKDVELYTAVARAKWIGSAFYIRLSAEYAQTFKGRARENFSIEDEFLGDLSLHVSDPVKRRSEFFDFDGAVGYPFTFLNNCGYVVPLIGFSFHRQRMRVKHHEKESFTDYFSIESSNPFGFPSSSYSIPSSSGSSSSSSSDIMNPFDCNVDSEIAELFGFSPERKTCYYRFTWYGFYLGADAAYALDPDWTIFGDFAFHVFDRAHRKRRSFTAVDVVDKFHTESWAWGYNTRIGTTFSITSCWYSTITVNFKWWKTTGGHHDRVTWKSTDINATIGYVF